MIDRGFIKWQPFNSLISGKEVLNDLTKQKIITKPVLFPEELQKLNEEIINAYYAQNIITLVIYQNNQITQIKTKIKEIYPTSNTLKLANNKVISFNQIIAIN